MEKQMEIVIRVRRVGDGQAIEGTLGFPFRSRGTWIQATRSVARRRLASGRSLTAFASQSRLERSLFDKDGITGTFPGQQLSAGWVS